MVGVWDGLNLDRSKLSWELFGLIQTFLSLSKLHPNRRCNAILPPSGSEWSCWRAVPCSCSGPDCPSMTGSSNIKFKTEGRCASIFLSLDLSPPDRRGESLQTFFDLDHLRKRFQIIKISDEFFTYITVPVLPLPVLQYVHMTSVWSSMWSVIEENVSVMYKVSPYIAYHRHYLSVTCC